VPCLPFALHFKTGSFLGHFFIPISRHLLLFHADSVLYLIYFISVFPFVLPFKPGHLKGPLFFWSRSASRSFTQILCLIYFTSVFLLISSAFQYWPYNGPVFLLISCATSYCFIHITYSNLSIYLISVFCLILLHFSPLLLSPLNQAAVTLAFLYSAFKGSLRYLFPFSLFFTLLYQPRLHP
jgi:hypothetical protein